MNAVQEVLRDSGLKISLKGFRTASTIKVAFFDVDGVFTDNRVLEGGPSKSKWRSYYDGQGISLLRAIGIYVCLITNEKGESAKHIEDVVEKWNRLPSSSQKKGDGGWHHVKLYTGMGGANKVVAAEEFVAGLGINLYDCAFMCDDLVDSALARKVGLVAAPITAEEVIKKQADFVSRRSAGHGAVRDFANFILVVRRIDPETLSPQ